ncbi:nuclease-related domain-containing protein [Galbitalea soli]|uniref:NERD domain-containing protein n=1 Tax=Galbitalea soli TaxID=1268042 RepID=A0A7C9TPM4_9MICO|nr:nuclease-related domain-containing protein [Galbitalea soli]NEM90379.1 NERD domain-containing protein [Galbitalea soli]NYJ31089.1 hypothetical protein [Galbitalea soli]
MSDGHALRARVPGQSVMSDFVSTQRQATPRTRVQRLFGRSPISGENRVRYRGALGELLVGDALDHLGPEWDVLHAVPAYGARPDEGYEIDHLVIGPAGVFTILTKNHPGEEVWVGGNTMTVAGVREEHIDTARAEARSAAALLSAAAGHPVEVHPVLVMVNPTKFQVREQPDGVTVLTSRQLVRWLLKADRVLSGEQVASVSDVADRPSSWRTPSVATQDTEQLHRDFAEFRSEVTIATRRRLLWASLAFVGVCLAVWASVAVIVVRLLLG